VIKAGQGVSSDNAAVIPLCLVITIIHREISVTLSQEMLQMHCTERNVSRLQFTTDAITFGCLQKTPWTQQRYYLSPERNVRWRCSRWLMSALFDLPSMQTATAMQCCRLYLSSCI